MTGWLAWALAALVAWGLWAVMSRLLGDGFSGELSQALSTVGFVPILVAIGVSAGKKLRRASRRGLGLALLGGVVSCLGNVPYYAAVARGERFATVVSLTALAPLVTVLLAVGLLRERFNRVQAAGLALAMVAIWLFNVPDESGLWSRAVVVALAPIALWGLSGFLQKAATNHVASEPAALIYLGAFVPMGLFYALTEPWPGALSLRTWLLAAGMGFCLAFGNFAVLTAYARGGKAAVIAPLANLYPLVSIGIALLLGDAISRRELLGVACALGSVAALSWEGNPRSSAKTAAG